MEIRRVPTGLIQANTYLAWDPDTKKGFLVDPGDFSQMLADIIEEEGIDLQYIILTHGHGDHICGTDAFRGRYPGVKVIAHVLADEILQSASLNGSTNLFGRPVAINTDIKVEEGDTLNIGNETLHFIHTPGHSKGGMCIKGDGFVFTGDTLFRESIGRTDFYGGDFKTLEKSIKEKLYTLPGDTIVYPGHMDITTIEYEKGHNLFVHD